MNSCIMCLLAFRAVWTIERRKAVKHTYGNCHQPQNFRRLKKKVWKKFFLCWSENSWKGFVTSFVYSHQFLTLDWLSQIINHTEPLGWWVSRECWDYIVMKSIEERTGSSGLLEVVHWPLWSACASAAQHQDGFTLSQLAV